MKILNLYYSGTGNTRIIADKIEEIAKLSDHEVDTIEVKKEVVIEFLDYDFIFMGSGVYHWLPGKPPMKLIDKACVRYRETGDMLRNAKRRDHIPFVHNNYYE